MTIVIQQFAFVALSKITKCNSNYLPFLCRIVCDFKHKLYATKIRSFPFSSAVSFSVSFATLS